MKSFLEFVAEMEAVPTNNVGSGNIAGTSVNTPQNNQGEPGIELKKKKKVVLTKTFTRKQM